MHMLKFKGPFGAKSRGDGPNTRMPEETLW